MMQTELNTFTAKIKHFDTMDKQKFKDILSNQSKTFQKDITKKEKMHQNNLINETNCDVA